jgi:hypothetical protein
MGRTIPPEIIGGFNKYGRGSTWNEEMVNKMIASSLVLTLT